MGAIVVWGLRTLLSTYGEEVIWPREVTMANSQLIFLPPQYEVPTIYFRCIMFLKKIAFTVMCGVVVRKVKSARKRRFETLKEYASEQFIVNLE